MMSIAMTREEIRTKYSNHWILIDQPVLSATHDLISGIVVCASTNREEIDTAARSMPIPRNLAIECTRALPKRVALT